MFKNELGLTDEGYKMLKTAVVACIIKNFTLIIPMGITIQIIMSVLNPYFGGNLNTTRIVFLFLAGIAGAVMIYAAFNNEYNKTYKVSYEEAERSRIAVAEHIRKLPLSFFNKKNLSDITTNIMADCANIEQMLSHAVPQIASNIISCTAICIMLIFYDWRLALALYITLPVSIFIIVISKKTVSKYSEELTNAKLAVSNQTQEYLEGMKVLQAFCMQDSKFTGLEKDLVNLKKMSIKFELIAGMLVTLASIVLASGMGIVVFVGSTFLATESVSLQVFFTFVIISSVLYSPLIVLFTFVMELFYLSSSIKRLKNLYDEPLMTGKSDAVIVDTTLELKNITFAYNENDVIKDISMTVKPGSVNAFVGPSGSGKTTLAKLIGRFWDVKNGNISIGGIDIKTLDPEYIMRYMSFVFQDVQLFNDTVYNNIKIGKENATEEEVLEAAKKAMCDGIVSKFPDGYNTLIGENGCTLSGGERQRISIARAMLKNAPIIILDEATASLDPENETAVQQALTILLENKTAIVIAHRLKTVQDADNIFVLNEGKLAESGRHSELMDKKGIYYNLFTIQAEASGWHISKQ